MIDFLWHLLLGIGIGAYFFNANVRSGVNDIIKRIAVGLYSMLNDHYNDKKSRPARQTTSTTKQENVGYKTSGAVKSMKTNASCNCGGMLIPADGVLKGFGVCSQCQSIKALK